MPPTKFSWAQTVENNMLLTKEEFKKVNASILEIKEMIKRFSVVYVKNGNGLIAGYDRAEFEKNLYNEIKSRPTLEDVKNLLSQESNNIQQHVAEEIDGTPRKKLSKYGKIAKEWSAIINFAILVTVILLYFLSKITAG